MGDRSLVFAKSWDPLFSTNRIPKEEDSWVEFKRGNNVDHNGISLLFRDFEDRGPGGEFDEVEDLCRNVNLSALHSGRGSAGYNKDAWLDDRSSSREESGENFREYQNPLTASELYRHLNAPVRKKFRLSDSAKAVRLMDLILAIPGSSAGRRPTSNVSISLLKW
jgi:hypothetical protein